MEISVLQSLIDRNSNEISEFEGCIQFEKDALKAWLDERDCERGQRKWAIKYYKSRLPKLRKIQKVLKREIKEQLENAALRRFYDSM